VVINPEGFAHELSSPGSMDAASWRTLLSQNNRFINMQTALPDALLAGRQQHRNPYGSQQA